jgi:hypothetical protein
MDDRSKTNGITLENSLQAYFYDELSAINQKALNPVPNEAIYYSSRVLDLYCSSKHLFDMENGKVKEKILGVKLLEVTHFPKNKQKRVLKDVGDTSLFLCGYFSEALNKKIVDTSYYQNLGQIAYRRLNGLSPDLYQIPSFYNIISDTFETLSMLIGIVAKNNFQVAKEIEEQEMLLFVNESQKPKVS